MLCETIAEMCISVLLSWSFLHKKKRVEKSGVLKNKYNNFFQITKITEYLSTIR